MDPTNVPVAIYKQILTLNVKVDRPKKQKDP